MIHHLHIYINHYQYNPLLTIYLPANKLISNFPQIYQKREILNYFKNIK